MTTATLTRTDREIEADLLAELRWDSKVPGTEIGVAVKDGVVTLTGTVDTFLKKWRAEEDAQNVNCPGRKDSGDGRRRLGNAQGRSGMAIPKQEVECVVRRLWGVKGISNLIVIKPLASPADLKKKTEDALVRSAGVDAKNITVEVQASKAILKGKLRSWAEKQEAERTAWLAPGITSVDNQISFF
jgi:osmotically-inducible protein OsmY